MPEKNVLWARVDTLGFIGCGSAAETVEPWKPWPISGLVQVNFATLY